jgi:hypothetical protein
MKRGLLPLNLFLLALLALVGGLLWQRWSAAKDREARLLARRPAPLLNAAPVGTTATDSARPANYFEVAERLLFAKDRNPLVIVDQPAPKAPPPPPPPMPALPLFYGMMDLGDGLMAIMAASSGERQKPVKPGESVGEFTLRQLSAQQIILEWKDKTVVKKPDELRPLLTAGDSAPALPPSASSPANQLMNPTRSALPAAVAEPTNAPPVPGRDMGEARKECQPGDNSPSGTMNGGYRKVLGFSPFGRICYWEKVN